MANFEIAVIKSNNERVREMIEESKKDNLVDIDIFEDSISLRARSGYTNQIMKNITREVRDISIKVSISYDAERYDKTWKVKYFNGLVDVYDVQVNYNIAFSSKDKEFLEETKEGLFEQVSQEIEDICRKMDIIERIEDESFHIDRYEDIKITIEFEKEGLNIKAIKEGPCVSLDSVEPFEDDFSEEIVDLMYLLDEEYIDDIPF